MGAPSFVFGELRAESERGAPLPLRHTEIEVSLFGPLARVQITQHFYNPNPDAIEAVYVLPLSHQGAISGLSLWVGERRIYGVIKEKTEAKEIYEEARLSGAHAALLEQETGNLFTLSVANILPKEAIRVELTLDELLSFDAGRWQLVAPLTYVPPYHPKDLPKPSKGTKTSSEERHANEERSRGANKGSIPALFLVEPGGPQEKAPPQTKTRTMSLSVQGSFATPLREVRSPSFAIEIKSQELPEGTFSLTLASQEEPPDRDFVLEIWPLAEKISPVLLAHKPKEKTGTFLLTLLPDATPTAEELAPREVAFLLDRSGSMYGAPIGQARKALQGCLRALGPIDTFSLVAFDDEIEELCKAPLVWSQKTLDEADFYLSTIDARGGTEMVPALEHVLKKPQDPSRQRLVVFLTDGAVSNVQEAISAVEKQIQGARVYTFGIGSAVNRALLDGIAKAGKGVAEYLTEDEDIEAALLRFQSRISAPLLTDLTLSASPEVVAEVFPRPLPDLFAGQALQIAGRFVGEEPAILRLRGRRGKQLFEGKLFLTPNEEPFLGAMLARLWAKRRIEFLLDELRRSPNALASIRQEIIGLGILHHIVTPYTSLVAVEEKVLGEKREPPRRVLVPNLLPKGVSPLAWLTDAGTLQTAAKGPKILTTSGFQERYQKQQQKEREAAKRRQKSLSKAKKSSALKSGGIKKKRGAKKTAAKKSAGSAVMRSTVVLLSSSGGKPMSAPSSVLVVASAPTPAEEAPAPIKEELRQLARTQRASGAWGGKKDDLAATCLAVVQMAASHETHRAGSFQVQLMRAMAFLQSRLQKAKDEEVLLIAWVLRAVALVTQHPGDQALWQGSLQKIPARARDKKTKLARGDTPLTCAQLLSEGKKLFFP